MKLLFFTILFLVLSLPTLAADYYTSPSGTGSTCSIGSPCALQTALNKSLSSGDNIYLRGGTYNGKFRSTLTAGTVRSFAGEWAKIDGYQTTTLSGAINASQTSFTVADGSNIFTASTDEIVIDSEVIKVFSKSGNTITDCLRGASGTIGSPASHSSGATVIIAGTQLYVAGSNTTYRDFEVMNSGTNRDDAVIPELGRGNGIFNIGDSNKFVNLIVHDNDNGIFTSSVSSNTEINGCLIYNNGVFNGTAGKGHGMYLENTAGYSRIYNTISINNFNEGAQFYGVTGAYVGGDCDGSVFANNGSPLRGLDSAAANYNLIYGTDSVVSATGSVKNSHFYHLHSINGYNFVFGYGAGVTSGTMTGNYFVGGSTLAQATTVFTTLTATGNKFYSRYSGVTYTIVPSGKSWTWNSNTYYDGVGKTPYGVQSVGNLNFTNWKSTTGFDASATETSSAMPDTVVVQPSSYQTGRAHVIIYAPSNPSSINVNLSTTGLANGQGYTIKNAFNYFGTAVQSGTYNSGSPTVSVSLTGAATSVATPIGMGFTPATTVTDFAVLIVEPTSSAITVRYFFNAPPA